MLARELDGLQPVGGVGQHLETGVLEHEPQLGARIGIVLHGEDGG